MWSEFERPPRSTFCTSLLLVFLLATAGLSAAAEETPPTKGATETKAADPATDSDGCHLLDNPEIRATMDGLLYKLLRKCGRTDELGQVASPEDPRNKRGETKRGKGTRPQERKKKVDNDSELAPTTKGGDLGDDRGAAEKVGTDVPISDPSGDAPPNETQSETSMAYNPNTGTICAAHNDSYHGITENTGFSGFARSTDGGATFVDQGPIGAGNSGDPSLVWSQRDGRFYYAALSGPGLSIWQSSDDCVSFVAVGVIHTGSGDDKELMAVDNNLGTPRYGRLYVHWTDFNVPAIMGTYSDDGGVTWSTPVQISSTLVTHQGAWPVVAPNGDVFTGWVNRADPITVHIARSTDGGDTFTEVTSPAASKPEASNPGATASCGRTALNGNIRYLPSPQIAVGPNGDLHAVYSYDPDGAGPDTIDVFYRRSTDSGATWQPEIRVNDDATTTDQFFPTLTVGDTNIVSVSFYDRRNDTANNLLFETWQATSPDGGVTWLANVKVSDVQSSVTLDGNLATCYHGDYDTHIQVAGAAILQWTDDRNGNMDTFSDMVALGTDFLLVSPVPSATVCAPADANYTIDVLQFNAFSEDVTLSANAWPAGLNAAFGTNPVSPGGSSTLTVSGTGVAGFGTYNLNVVGTSSPGAVVHDTDLSLEIFTAAPAATILTTPADNATDVPLMTTFTWSAAAQASTYTLDVATDGAFSNIIYTAMVSGTTHDNDTSFPSSTQLYWRVRASNTCGSGSYSATRAFVTESLPGDCGPGLVAVPEYEEDFESGAGGWTTAGTGSTWQIETGDANSGTEAFQADDVAEVSDQYLISPAMALPDATSPLSLLFWNKMDIEEQTGGAACFDGAVVEVSINGGGTWTRLEAEILVEAYNGPVSNDFSSPIQGENAWCDVRDWTRFVVDVEAFGGETAQFRFRLATDVSVSAPGWWIDDVSVSSCASATDIFEDGFEIGTVDNWTNSLP